MASCSRERPTAGLRRYLAAGFCSRAVVIFAAVLAWAFAVACAPRSATRTRTAPSGGSVRYADVQAIISDNCEHCHNEDKIKGGLLMESYEGIVAGGDHGSALIPGDSASSRMVQMIEGKLKPRMPYKEDPLSRAQIDVIRRWIDAGARAPAASEAAAAAPD